MRHAPIGLTGANVCSATSDHLIVDSAHAKLVHYGAAEPATKKIAADRTAKNWFRVVEFETATRHQACAVLRSLVAVAELGDTIRRLTICPLL
jgi:hypothetical protein